MASETPPEPTKLADALASVASPRKGPYCTVGRLLEALPDPDADALRGVITRMRQGESIGAMATKVLREAGHNVGTGALQRHARGDCRCVTSANGGAS